MAVWGIGAYFQGEGDITKDCLKEKVAVIGYMEEEKPRYYEMIQSVEVGDLIFIKSRFMLNQPLRIKAVGFVDVYKRQELWLRRDFYVLLEVMEIYRKDLPEIQNYLISHKILDCLLDQEKISL